MRRIVALLCLLAGPASAETGSDPVELDRTYEAALVYLPGAEGPEQGTVADLSAHLVDAPALVLYMHGCSGIIEIAHAAGRMYAQAGYVFVAPDSFARAEKPASCRPEVPEGGLHRAVLGWRQAEAGHAIAQLRRLTDAPIVLVGHSEGAITAATFTGAPLAARVIEGWTCNAGWPEYIGLSAPEAEPVLSLVGKRDPWFRLPILRGDCGEFMDANDRSVVFKAPDPLFDQHWTSGDAAVRALILAFLRDQL
ncbi:hypothetical protein KUD11_03430 [Roseovarius sp. LXJ103]|uniref:hypothetical protein n=1 Tax=Roseovarius carneus TaxID=2853164 RepID=UPI000D616E40|nr:hypothetical protein [Roseovarius carneus]MBZ8117695.1 hypothetical protein [Roseovarius carneus]PWE36529.1 hypothetical protein DD563_11515 [Pelagicola sp. LXJ1103]